MQSSLTGIIDIKVGNGRLFCELVLLFAEDLTNIVPGR